MRFQHNVLLHPIRAVKYAIRRMVLRADAREVALTAELPPSLQRFVEGERVPLKGTWFEVGKLVGGDYPVIILVPRGLTHGAKLGGLRRARDLMRVVDTERKALRGAAVREALR